MALPFIEQLQIPSIIDKALQKVSIDSKTGATYNSFDVLMTLLLGFLLKCETYDDIHATLGGYKSLGVWLGKDKQRLPSIEIIKEHVRQLATPYFIKDLKRLLSHSVAKAGIVDLGVLYIDSHFMAYYGKHNISKGYSTIRRLALRGTYHHFVGDRQGRPVTFYLTEGAVRLHRTLTALLKDVQYLRQKHDPDRPLFLVFDREIYDAKLFKRLDRKQIVFLTYIKNASEYPDEKFKKTITVPFRTKFTEYELFATYTSISGYHDRVKALVIRNPDTKRQSVIITNSDRVKFRGKHIKRRNDTLVGLMVNRWSQENFFKRAVNEFNINHHFGYKIQARTRQPMIGNPQMKEAKKKLASLKNVLQKKESKIVTFLEQDETSSLEMLAESKPKFRELWQSTLSLKEEIYDLKQYMSTLPEKVCYTDVFPEKPRKACILHKKDLLDTLKVMGILVLLLMEEKFQRCHTNRRTVVPTLEKILSQPVDLIISHQQAKACLHPFRFRSTQRSAETFCHNLNLKPICHPFLNINLTLEVAQNPYNL